MRLPAISGFDWDVGNRTKCQRHGVSHEEIESLFERELLLAPDPWSQERRMRAIGVTSAGRRVFVVFTIRTRLGEAFIRPISARFMHQREWSAYVEAQTAPIRER